MLRDMTLAAVRTDWDADMLLGQTKDKGGPEAELCQQLGRAVL